MNKYGNSVSVWFLVCLFFCFLLVLLVALQGKPPEATNKPTMKTSWRPLSASKPILKSTMHVREIIWTGLQAGRLSETFRKKHHYSKPLFFKSCFLHFKRSLFIRTTLPFLRIILVFHPNPSSLVKKPEILGGPFFTPGKTNQKHLANLGIAQESKSLKRSKLLRSKNKTPKFATTKSIKPLSKKNFTPKTQQNQGNQPTHHPKPAKPAVFQSETPSDEVHASRIRRVQRRHSHARRRKLQTNPRAVWGRCSVKENKAQKRRSQQGIEAKPSKKKREKRAEVGKEFQRAGKEAELSQKHKQNTHQNLQKTLMGY